MTTRECCRLRCRTATACRAAAPPTDPLTLCPRYCQQIKYNQQGAKVVDGMKELGIEARVRGAPKPLTSYERYCLALDPDSPSAVACERTLIDVANRASE